MILLLCWLLHVIVKYIKAQILWAHMARESLSRVEEGEERDGRGVDAQALERLGRAGGPRGVGQRGEELREGDEAPQRAAGHEREVEEHPHRPERGQHLTPYPRYGAATRNATAAAGCPGR